MAKNIRRIEEGLSADIVRRREEAKVRAARITEKRRAWENEHIVLTDLLYGAATFLAVAAVFAAVFGTFRGGL